MSRQGEMVGRVLAVIQDHVEGEPHEGAAALVALEDVLVNGIVHAAVPGAELVTLEKLVARARARLPRAALRVAPVKGNA